MHSGHDACLFPVTSSEALWDWHLPSDGLTLSRGALQALHLTESEAPSSMRAYLEHVPPPARAALLESRRKILENPADSFLETSYAFDGALVLERMLVLKRDGAGRALRLMGQCTISGAKPMLAADQPVVTPRGAGVWCCSLDTRTIFMDARCAELLGYPGTAPRAMALDEWQSRLPAGESSAVFCRHKELVAGPEHGDVIDEMVRVRLQSGDDALMSLRGAVLERDASGRATRLGGTLRDTQDFPLLGEQDGRENGRLLLAVNVTGDGLWDWDAQTDSVYYSPRYLSMLGYTNETFPPRLDVWEAKIHPDDYDKFVPIQKAMVESPAYGDSFECTYRIKKADGTWAWILGRGYVTHRNPDGRATRLVGLHTDITASQGDREKLEELVKNDALTGLRSRTFCDLELERVENDRLRPVSVISCDVNGLKLINDYLGHAAGDELLRKTAQLLRRPLRMTDCVARMGGDEFVVLLPGCSRPKAEEILAHLRRGVEDANARNGMPVFLAFGLASTDDPREPVSKLLRDADRAMLTAKAAERRDSHRRIKAWLERNRHVSVSLEDSRYES